MSGKVTFKGSTGAGSRTPSARVRTILEEEAAKLDTDIRVVRGIGTKVEGRKPEDASFDGIVIYDFSTPGDDAGRGPVSMDSVYSPNYGTLYCEITPRMARKLTSSTEFEPLRTTDTIPPGSSTTTTVDVGCFDYRTMWFYVPIANFNRKDQFTPWLGNGLAKCIDKDFWQNRKERMREELEEHFLKRLDQSAKNELELQKKAIEQATEKIGVYSSNIVQLEIRVVQAQQAIDYLEKKTEGKEDLYRDQLKSLFANPRIEHISWDQSRNALSVDTDGIYLYSPSRKERAYLGKFRFSFAQTGEILMINQDNKRGGYDAPHVSNTHPCWGGSGRAVAKLTARGEVCALFDVCCAYLEQFNPNDSAGTLSSYWFTVDESEILVDGEWKFKKDLKQSEINKALAEESIKGEADDLPDEEILTEEELEVQ